MSVEKVWLTKHNDPLLQYILSRELHISPTLALLLINRGIRTVEEAGEFIQEEPARLHDPLLMKDMDRAVKRILTAIERKEKILVYGDYDADGITGTALMVKVLEKLEGNVDYYIPHRIDEGYGLHLQAVQRAMKEGFDLIVTVDCGISGSDVISQARDAGGPDFVITDHHQIAPELPAAAAVVNPRRPDCAYPFRDLAGVGVALKLAQALLQQSASGQENESWQEYLELACVGTVADVVPLRGENRVLVKHGLSSLPRAANTGLQALLAASGLKKESLDAKDVSFVLVPRLNATGRMGDAKLAVKLLLCGDPEEAGHIAAQLDKCNRQRQEIEAGVFKEARDMLSSDSELAGSIIPVAASAGWHPGVIGIVAARLVELLCRPVLMIALEKGKGKGSGRSVPGFHLYNALLHCNRHLLAFGGHAGAVGFSMEAGQIENFRKALNEYADKFLPDEYTAPRLKTEITISLAEVTEQLAAEIMLLSPFGYGNPEPVLGCSGVTVARSREVGREGKHLKLLLQENGALREAIGFGLADPSEESMEGKTVDLAFTPVLNNWNGQTSVQLQIKEIRPADELAKTAACSLLPGHGPEAKSESLSAVNNCESFLNALFNSALHLLATEWDTMSMPEFAWSLFEEYRSFGNPVYLPGWCEKKAGGSVAPKGKNSNGISFVDLRNTTGRSSILAGLTAGENQTLIVADCPRRTVELAAHLRPACPDKPVAFFHQLLSPAEREAILYFFAGGLINTIVTTANFLPDFKNTKAGRLVVYNLPYDQQEWLLALTGILPEKGAGVYLLFGENDKKAMEERLSSLAPDRNLLARLYLLMRQLNNESIPRLLTALTAALQKAGLKWVKEYTTGIGIAVLHELGLLEHRRQGNEYTIIMPPSPKEKLKLEESRLFCHGQKAKSRMGVWHAHILNAPLKEAGWQVENDTVFYL